MVDDWFTHYAHPGHPYESLSNHHSRGVFDSLWSDGYSSPQNHRLQTLLRWPQKPQETGLAGKGLSLPIFCGWKAESSFLAQLLEHRVFLVWISWVWLLDTEFQPCKSLLAFRCFPFVFNMCWAQLVSTISWWWFWLNFGLHLDRFEPKQHKREQTSRSIARAQPQPW